MGSSPEQGPDSSQPLVTDGDHTTGYKLPPVKPPPRKLPSVAPKSVSSATTMVTAFGALNDIEQRAQLDSSDLEEVDAELDEDSVVEEDSFLDDDSVTDDIEEDSITDDLSEAESHDDEPRTLATPMALDWTDDEDSTLVREESSSDGRISSPSSAPDTTRSEMSHPDPELDDEERVVIRQEAARPASQRVNQLGGPVGRIPAPTPSDEAATHPAPNVAKYASLAQASSEIEIEDEDDEPNTCRREAPLPPVSSRPSWLSSPPVRRGRPVHAPPVPRSSRSAGHSFANTPTGAPLPRPSTPPVPRLRNTAERIPSTVAGLGLVELLGTAKAPPSFPAPASKPSAPIPPAPRSAGPRSAPIPPPPRSGAGRSVPPALGSGPVLGAPKAPVSSDDSHLGQGMRKSMPRIAPLPSPSLPPALPPVPAKLPPPPASWPGAMPEESEEGHASPDVSRGQVTPVSPRVATKFSSMPPLEAPARADLGRKAPLSMLLGGLALAASLVIAVLALWRQEGDLYVEVRDDAGNTIPVAEVFIDGQKQCDATPCVVRETRTGTKLVQVLADGHGSDGPVAAHVESGSDNRIVVTLERSLATLKAKSSQKGIQLFVDGTDRGTLPVELSDLQPGKHELRFEAKNYETKTQTVDLEVGEPLALSDVTLDVARGIVQVDVSSDSARVLLVKEGGKAKVLSGPFPRTVELDPDSDWKIVGRDTGRDEIVAKIDFSDGVAEKTVKVSWTDEADEPKPVASVSSSDLPRGGASATAAPTREAEPEPKPEPSDVKAETGTLNVNSIPVSKVMVDGRPVGETPKVNMTLPVGTHTITFVHPELGKRSVSVQIKAGVLTRAAVKLRD